MATMIADPCLPAAAHLTGPHAGDVLGVAVEASGAELLHSRPVQVQYRPESDLIVRYAARVRRPDGTEVDETLLAGVTRSGPHRGTVPVEAVTDDGEVVEAGVWRWPFDPVLVDLAQLVSPNSAAAVLGDVLTGPVAVEVVVYRPCDRVVARLSDDTGRAVYVKLVDPDAVEPIVQRHVRLRTSGVPVPVVLAVGPTWLAMEAIEGPTLRQLVRDGGGPLPDPSALVAVARSFAGVDLSAMPPVRRRLTDAVAHASMLATVHPGEAGRLRALADLVGMRAAATAARCGTVIHGDLHEGQLIVRDGRVVGVLDVDDAGPGDPLDDMATLLAHLRYRALTQPAGAFLDDDADGLRRAAAEHLDVGELDVATGAALIGLATGPFRIQQSDWPIAVSAVLDLAERHVQGDGDERCLRAGSSASHAQVAP